MFNNKINCSSVFIRRGTCMTFENTQPMVNETVVPLFNPLSIEREKS